MFENIIGQKDTIGALRGDLAQARLPRASLFVGPFYSAKLSAALEVARVLTCTAGSAEWSCECHPCRLQKELLHPHTVLLGPRYSDIEIPACAEALKHSRKPATLYLFLRAVRKLTRRFDTSVMDTEDTRMKGVQDKVGRVEELLADLVPGNELPPEKILDDLLDKIIAAAATLAQQIRADGITIGQVRRLAAWTHMTASTSRKVAILENADRMQDSARNAMLKLLEEPPEGVHLILLSTRRAAIIPTILSRLRPYVFAQRAPAEEREVMTRIFRQDTPSATNLRGFFLSWREINPEKLAGLSRGFMDSVLSDAAEGTAVVEQLSELFPERGQKRERSPKEVAGSFLEELTFRFHEILRQGTGSVDMLEGWTQAVREASARMETYNMNPAEVLEAMYHRMRADREASA